MHLEAGGDLEQKVRTINALVDALNWVTGFISP